MRAPTIKQFKLTNNDEIICEVIEWDTHEDANILMRAAMKIIQGEDPERGIRYYSFRPWMGFQDNPDVLQTLNAGHIIGEVSPSETLLDHYASTIKEYVEASKTKKYADLALDDVIDMDDEEFEEYLSSKMENLEEPHADSGNVIQFPKTLH